MSRPDHPRPRVSDRAPLRASARGVRPVSRPLWALLVLAVLCALPSPASADITYIYDELGRLVGVVDPAGDTVTHTYDAVGNLLSIARHPSSQVSIIEFTPNSGPVGTAVTISGTGFSATPSQNTVTFNGLTAFVTASTATQITTSVPAGATSGPIQVTAPGGSATSATPFTVTASSAPTITGFTPTLGSAGTAVTVTGTNFEPYPPANKLLFNIGRAAISAATATSLSTTVPTGTGSGRLTVTTPNGTAVSAADFFIPPSGYTVAQVATTGRIGSGQSLTTPVIPSSQIGLLVFDGSAGQRVSLVTTSAAAGQARLYQPNGQLVVFWYIGNQFSDVVALPVAGTYTLLLEGAGAAVTVTLYDVPPDVTGTITPGGPAVPVTITTPGQNAHLTFTGAQNQWISLTVSGPSFGYGPVTVRKPDGSPLTSGGLDGNGWMFLDRTPLPTAGTYTIDIDPSGANTGTLTVTLYDIVDVTGSLTINGPGFLVDITVPGQNARLTFAGTAGQPLSLVVTGAAGRPITFRIFNPDGTLHQSRFIQGWINITLQMTPLAQTGTHTLEVDYGGVNTGTVTVGLTSP